MSSLNAKQLVELEGEVAEFVRNCALMGVKCIVVLEGQGADRLAYPVSLVQDAAAMLARAYHTACKRKRETQN